MRKEILKEINGILINISSALSAERSTVFLINEEKAMLESLISQGIRNNLISMPLNCGIAGYVASNGEPQIINNVKTSDFFNPYFDGVTGFKTEKVICTPIISDMGQTIGVIQSLNKKDQNFSENDLRILKVFAETIALALKNARLYSSAETIKKDIATLLKFSSTINSELDLTKLIKLVIQKSSEITNSDRSSFFLYNEEEEVLWTKYGEGLGNQIIKTKKGLASFVAKTKKPLIENAPYDNPLWCNSIYE